MPSPEAVAAYVAQAVAVIVSVSVPLGLLGSAIEKFGHVFLMPRVEAFGDKLEKFFFDLPGLMSKPGSGK